MTTGEAARYERVRELFLAARELPEDEREAFVRERAGADAPLGDEVLRLCAHDQRDDFLEKPALEGGVTLGPTSTIEDESDFTPGGTRRDEEYPPGRVLVGRYRVVTRIGEGGMGEVYLADDLTLEQPVALKFLPRATASLDRLRQEVRLARRVSHPNVGRVHDIGEVDGRSFLTMEYVDGEDLASLLRQIGRLPKEKALDIAQQLCAGLAAAHEHAVMHRDLKPSNVMLDRTGHVRVMDFGVATLKSDRGTGEIAGTPAYMAPEQLSGEAVTERSEVFTLGLLMFELFTGRRAVEGRSLLEVARVHRDGLRLPEGALDDLEPRVARAIEHCLAPRPADRPASVHEVRLMLPGGDPLEAALAAGETPSPHVIARAGGPAMLSPARAWGLALVTLVGGVLSHLLWSRTQPIALTPLDKPPAVLLDRARELLDGTLDVPVDERVHEHAGFAFDFASVRAQQRAQPERNPRRDWPTLHPSPITFWYRTGPNRFVPVGLGSFEIGPDNPPHVEPGMTRVRYDPRGLLVSFEHQPSPVSCERRSGRPWDELFAHAGLDLGAFRTVAPTAVPRSPVDERLAWVGPAAAGTGEVRVEAALFQDAPVLFQVTGPRLDAAPEEEPSWTEFLVKLGMIVGGVVIAWRNVRSGRGDRTGANRLAAFVFVCVFLSWLLRADHVLALSGLDALLDGAATALLRAALVWIFYLAAEGIVRRLWPRILTSWMCVLAGELHDPRVARDTFVGAAFGTLLSLVFLGYEALPADWLGGSPVPDQQVTSIQVASLSGLAPTLGHLAYALQHVLVASLMSVVLLILLRFVLRREALAIVAQWVLMSFAFNFHEDGSHPAVQMLGAGLIVLVQIRFGLFAQAVALCVMFLLVAFPHGLSGWTAERAPLALLLFLALTAYGLVGATRGRLFASSPARPASPARSSP